VYQDWSIDLPGRATTSRCAADPPSVKKLLLPLQKLKDSGLMSAVVRDDIAPGVAPRYGSLSEMAKGRSQRYPLLGLHRRSKNFRSRSRDTS
jgi:hypothetical protein